MGADVQDTGHVKDEFDAEVVSAFSEAFNNIAIHGYAGMDVGTIEVEIELFPEAIAIHIADRGHVFDPLSSPVPPPDKLPESGMGVFIMRSFMDTVTYRPGSPPHTPNVLTLFKRRNGTALQPQPRNSLSSEPEPVGSET